MHSLIVFVSGGLGAVARYVLGGWVASLSPAFPWGTLTVNVLGSFLISMVMQVALAGGMSAEMRLALTTGLLGGFTTYSTFNYETLRAFEQGAWAAGLANVAATVLICLAAGAAGLIVGRMLTA